MVKWKKKKNNTIFVVFQKNLNNTPPRHTGDQDEMYTHSTDYTHCGLLNFIYYL